MRMTIFPSRKAESVDSTSALVALVMSRTAQSDSSVRPASTPSSNLSAITFLSTSTTPSRKKMKVVKSTDDAIPLPDPFPLPKHFRADVEVALRTGKMSSESRRAFVSAIASAMLAYMRYPTRDDYSNVARAVCLKYEFLKSPAGIPHVCQHWLEVLSLVCDFYLNFIFREPLFKL